MVKRIVILTSISKLKYIDLFFAELKNSIDRNDQKIDIISVIGFDADILSAEQISEISNKYVDRPYFITAPFHKNSSYKYPYGEVKNRMFDIYLHNVGMVDGDMLYYLDDDTKLHSDFFSNIITYCTDTTCVYKFNQLDKNGRSRLTSSDFKIFKIDTGSMVISPMLISKVPFNSDILTDDGHWAENVSMLYLDKTKYVPIFNSYYNFFVTK